MILSSSLEKIFYNYVRNDLNLFNIVKPEYFKSKEIQNCYKIDHKFYEKYKVLPSPAQIKETVTIQNENLGLDEDEIRSELNKINNIFKVNLDEYEDSYLKDNVEGWITWQTLDASFFDAITYMKTTKVDIDNVNEVVQKVKQIILERNNLTFDFNTGLDFFDPTNHYSEEREAFSTGYPFLDSCLNGGHRKGNLIIFAGASGRGKSIWLCNLAVQSMKRGNNVAFISLEMGGTDVMARIGSNVFNVNINEYTEFSKNPQRVKKALSKFRKGDSKYLVEPGQLFVKEFPTGSAGLHEFEAYLTKVEETGGFKFDVIIIDYINIAKNWRNPNGDNTYLKIKQLSEDLRGMGQRNEWSIVSATQLNREGSQSSDIRPENISESMGLIFTVDAAFAILQDEEQKAAGIYVLKNIKARNSGLLNTRKRFLINYDHMRIVEDNDNAYINE